VFCSFLALLLKRELEIRLEEKGLDWEWKEIIRGFDRLARQLLLLTGVAPENLGFNPSWN
jgi:hypothetical protein